MAKPYIESKVKNALLKLDLSDKQAVVYLALLESGKSSVLEISRNSGMNRVTVYAAIDDLKLKGLIAESRKGKRRRFVAEKPEALQNLIDTEKNELDEKARALKHIILPALKTVETRDKVLPEILFFYGLSGIHKVYDDYILEAKAVLSCGSYDSVMRVSTLEIEREYIREIKKRKIFFRGILEDTTLNRKIDKLARGIMHNKFLPVDTKTSADILVFGKWVALISYEKENATLIADDSIADSLRLYLEFMWERL